MKDAKDSYGQFHWLVYQYGRLVGRYPLPFLLLPLTAVVAGGIGLGLIWPFAISSDLEECSFSLYISRQPLLARASLAKRFGGRTRFGGGGGGPP